MRCPSCGTENTPDSRFCGGCGAKLFPTDPTSRVAPTAKISDDAPFPPSIPPGQYVAPAPMQYASTGPASIPPSGGYAPPPPYVPTPVPGSVRAPSAAPGVSRANTAPPARSMYEPSMSIPVQARPRWGVIALVLVLDIGLATAGAILLGKGLAKPAPAKADPPAGSAAHAEVAPTGSASPAITAPPPGNGSALGNAVIAAVQAPPPAPPADAGVTVTPPSRHESGKKKPTPTSATTKPDPKPDPKPGGGPSPQDPYDAMKALAAEIELSASRAQGAFDQCYVEASAQAPIHGEVHIAFQVLPDGRVANVSAVRNDPNSGPLAGCLTNIILRWSFAAHPASATSFVRPFIYP